VLAATLTSGLGVAVTSCSNNIDNSAIFIHVKGSKPYTGGCISFDEERMVEILRNCDMSLVITIRE